MQKQNTENTKKYKKIQENVTTSSVHVVKHKLSHFMDFNFSFTQHEYTQFIVPVNTSTNYKMLFVHTVHHCHSHWKKKTYLLYGTCGRFAKTLQIIVCARASMHQTVGQNFSLSIGQWASRNECILSLHEITGFYTSINRHRQLILGAAR